MQGEEGQRPHHRHGCTGGLSHLPGMASVPESITDTGPRGLPAPRVPLCAPGAESRETAHWNMEGDNLLDFLPSVSQRHISRVAHGSILYRT